MAAVVRRTVTAAEPTTPTTADSQAITIFPRPGRATFSTGPIFLSSQVYPKGLPYNENVKKPQTLYIKNPAAHHLARQLSKHKGVTLTDAVIGALEDQLNAVKKPKPIDRKKIAALLEKMRALPVLDSRSPDEIQGYDEFGLPG
jgi:antitoxin VapB